MLQCARWRPGKEEAACRGPALQTVAVAVAVAQRSRVPHLGPRHLPPECREWWWEPVKAYAGWFREQNLKVESSGKKLNS